MNNNKEHIINEQKYKTAEERVEAFNRFCSRTADCVGCELRGSGTFVCQFKWLALEAEEDSIEPCVYCKSKMSPMRVGNTFRVYCNTCGYQSSGSFETMQAAIAAHNRVARAVRAASEMEVK